MVDAIFTRLLNIINQQQALINSISSKLSQIDSIGGAASGGTASINDYASGIAYKRNVLIVDTATETVYRVLEDYTSTNVTDDLTAGKLKLVGYESQVVTFSHTPTQTEIDTLPDDTLVAVYSTTDTPYVPDTQ